MCQSDCAVRAAFVVVGRTTIAVVIPLPRGAIDATIFLGPSWFSRCRRTGPARAVRVVSIAREETGLGFLTEAETCSIFRDGGGSGVVVDGPLASDIPT